MAEHRVPTPDPTVLNIRLAEKELRDSPTERPARPPSLLASENTKIKVEPGQFMGKAGAITDNMGLRARGVPAEGARCGVVGEVPGGCGYLIRSIISFICVKPQ